MLALLLCAVPSGFAEESSDGGRWRPYVTACLDTLIEHGTDVYGPVKTPMLMSIVDVRTLTSPEKPELFDGLVRTEGRRHRRAEGGANLWNDQSTLRAMYQMTDLTGDAKYSDSADAYIDYYVKHSRKENGLLIWGSHSHYNCYQDQAAGDRGVHEILVRHPLWDQMYRVNPEAIKTEIDAIWEYHIRDKETGRHNRHDSAGEGTFSFSGGSFIMGFAFMHSVTGEKHYLDKAKLVTDFHWNWRDPVTGLVPDSPGVHRPRWYNVRHFLTPTTGPHAAQLLQSYELSGDEHFRDVAIGYIKAYDKYGWDEQAKTYYGMLKLDGTPVTDRAQIHGNAYNEWAPIGHIDIWRTTTFPWEFAILTAQSSIYAYELSGEDAASRDPELLAISKRWAGVIERNLPPQTGYRFRDELEAALPNVKETGGTYAENYGRAISFYVHLYRASKDDKYLKLAESIAQEAVDKLYENGLFKGHPAKPYYDALDGVGLLLWALLELDAPSENLRGAF